MIGSKTRSNRFYSQAHFQRAAAMRVSLLRLFLVFAVVCVVAFGQEAAEQPKRTSFLRKLLSPVGFLYNKAKSGLGKIRRSFVSSKTKAIREAIENGENPLGDGVGAVMDAIDELVADGEASVGNAAKAVKDAVGETTASVKEAAASSQDALSAEAAGIEEAVASSKEEVSAGVDAAKAALDEAVVDAIAEVDAVKDEIKGLEEETATKVQEAVADATEEL